MVDFIATLLSIFVVVVTSKMRTQAMLMLPIVAIFAYCLVLLSFDYLFIYHIIKVDRLFYHYTVNFLDTAFAFLSLST